jgi:hypothetical protein
MPLRVIPSSFLSSCLPRLLTVTMSSHNLSSSGQLTLRLASTFGLQVIWVAQVRHLSWQPIRLVLLLGCLSSWAPLCLTLGFYRAQVWRLDVAHFNCKASWGQPSMTGVLSGHAPHALPESSMTKMKRPWTTMIFLTRRICRVVSLVRQCVAETMLR